MRLTCITPLTSGLVEVHTYENGDHAAASVDMKSFAVTTPLVASRIASRWGRRGIRPATYRDTAACEMPTRSAKSACVSLLRARNLASVMSDQYHTGMITQAPHTNSALDCVFWVKYRNGMNPLRGLRKKAKLSQQKLGDLAGTTQPTIQRLEKEPHEKNYRKMTVHWAQKLAPHLGVLPIRLLPQLLTTPETDSIDELLEGASPEIRQKAYRSVLKALAEELSKTG